MRRALSDTACRNAKPRLTIYYLPDIKGLRLCIRPNGSKLWMLRFTKRHPNGAKSESTAGLGSYPEVSLEQARAKAREARQAAESGVHPTTARRIKIAKNVEAATTTFESVANEWLEFNRSEWSDHHYERNAGLLKRILFKKLGPLPIGEITEPMLLAVLRTTYDSGTRESARRARAVASQVFQFAKDTHRCLNNPARDLADSSLLKRPEVKHFAALPQDRVGSLLRELDGNRIERVTRAAMLLMMYTGLRDYSLRAARWEEIDLENARWTIPAERMKSGREHNLPLPKQAVSELVELAKLTKAAPNSFVFASYGKAGHLAENTIRVALHRLGFEVTAHGFRSLITDVLNISGFNSDAIERQLDHVQTNKVRAAYLRSDFMAHRAEMMQWLADWYDAQRDETIAPPLPDNVIRLRRAA